MNAVSNQMILAYMGKQRHVRLQEFKNLLAFDSGLCLSSETGRTSTSISTQP